MKKRILSFVLFSSLIAGVNAQNFLAQLIRQGNGISKQYAAIPEDQTLKFNPLQFESLLNIAGNAGLVLKRTAQDELGFTHYRYYQAYRGIPIEKSMLMVHVKDGVLKSLGGAIVTDFDPLMEERASQKISAAQSIAKAIKYVGATLYAWQDKAMEQEIKNRTNDRKASYTPKAEMVWYSPGSKINPGKLRLCYKVDVYAVTPFSYANYFIDAITGDVIGKENAVCNSDATGTAATAYSGTVTIHSDLFGSSYRLRDLIKGSGIITLHGETGSSYGTDYYNPTANWTRIGTNKAVLDAHYGVSQTYAFYKAVFNRNSYNGSGAALYSYVNDPIGLNNAFWFINDNTMHFCKRSDSSTYPGGFTGIDVTGHEVTHGVTQNESNLGTEDEPGSINESMSDIMGKSIQFWAKPADINWVLSNDMSLLARSMSNPNLYGDPDTYLGTNWYTGPDQSLLIHTNTGVGNFMFYLLVNGGSGSDDFGFPYTVTAIGQSKAQQIIYRSNTTYLTPTSQYADWRTACINAATDLYGASSTEVIQVKNAWHAVGIGMPGYCTTIGSTASEYINKVLIGSINNTSGNNGGFGNYTGLTTNIAAGVAKSITLTPGFAGAARNEYWTVYIDYNHNGLFTEANEYVVLGNGTGAITKSFTVPTSAKNGSTRMRIIMHYNSARTTTCGTYTDGEVEDYQVYITGGTNFASKSITESLPANISVSPNPATSSSMRVDYTLENIGNVVLKLTDAIGQSNYIYKAGPQNKGANVYTISNLSSLHNGYYYLSIEQGGKAVGTLKVLVSH